MMVAGLTTDERAAVETLYRAFSEGKPELLDEAVTPDWQDIPLTPQQAPGRDGMKPLIGAFRTAFPDLNIAIHEIIGAPGRAAVRAEITGTHAGAWFGIAPTGKSFRMPIHEFHAIEQGRLTHTWHLEDWFGWLNQVGAWPAPVGRGTMKAARIHGYDAAPILEEVPTPDVGPADVLVRVAAAGLNPLDVKLQKGVMHGFFPLAFPYTIGTDLAGTVERVGADVVDWSAGDVVLARVDPTMGGALAEFAVVPASHLVAPPTSMAIELAAGIPTTAGTAWQALFEMGALQRGQTVLVHGGAGGVGSFAIQFAHSAGARVIATESGTGVEIARRLGADEVIDYRAENFAEKVSDVDLVLDTVGGDTQVLSFAVLRPGGVLLSTVSPPDETLAKAHDVSASFIVHMSDASRLTKVVDHIDAAGATVLLDRTEPLDAMHAAFTHQGSGRAHGKIVVAVR